MVRVSHRWRGRTLRGAAFTVAIVALMCLPVASAPSARSSVHAPPMAPGPADLVRSPVADTCGTDCSAPIPAAPLGLAGPSAWVNLTGSVTGSPSPREGAALVYDAADQYVLLFGGLGVAGTLHDTWKFANGTWTNLTPSLSTFPSGRYKAAMVYDSEDGFVLLFGGNSGSGYLNDTWKFHAGAWTKLTPAKSPTPREDISIADDLADHYVLLFGGEPNPPATPRPETWTFSAGAWTNLTPTLTTHPSGRESGAMAYDAADGYVLLFGGKHTPNAILQDTWTYSNGVWTNVTANVGTPPQIREATSISYDPVDRIVVLFGGLHFPRTYNDTWSYHALNWTRLALTNAPPARFDAPIAWTPATGAGFVLLFGGRVSPTVNSSQVNDTWAFKLPLGGGVTAIPATFDLGQSTVLTAAPSGGYPPITMSWGNLPIGCSSTAPSFTCTPSGTGTFGVTATFHDAQGNSYTSASTNVTVHTDPQVAATGVPMAGAVPLRVIFSSNTYFGTPPFTFNWSFGDSTNSSAANTTHTYGATGNYTAQLTVTDSTGFTASSAALPITVNGTLSASASALPATSGPAPFTVAFAAQASGGSGGYRYTWSFGDGVGSASTAQANYTYTRAGHFTATVTVTDLRGASVSPTVSITVTPGLTTAIDWSISKYYCEGTTGYAVLNATADPSGGLPPYSDSWSVAGTPSTGPTANLTELAGNTTPLGLTVTDARGVAASSNVSTTSDSLPCASVQGSSLTHNWLFWAAIVALVAVIALELFLVLRRRKK